MTACARFRTLTAISIVLASTSLIYAAPRVVTELFANTTIAAKSINGTSEHEQLHPRQDGQAIAARIIQDAFPELLPVIPRIKLVTNPRLYAYTCQDEKLVFSTGILSLVGSHSEFAFLIAHEIAHLVLKHGPVSPIAGTRDNLPESMQREIEADRLALRLVKNSGYPQGSGLDFLMRLSNYGKEQGVSMDMIYPSLSVRTAELRSLLGN